MSNTSTREQIQTMRFQLEETHRRDMAALDRAKEIILRQYQLSLHQIEDLERTLTDPRNIPGELITPDADKRPLKTASRVTQIPRNHFSQKTSSKDTNLGRLAKKIPQVNQVLEIAAALGSPFTLRTAIAAWTQAGYPKTTNSTIRKALLALVQIKEITSLTVKSQNDTKTTYYMDSKSATPIRVAVKRMIQARKVRSEVDSVSPLGESNPGESSAEERLMADTAPVKRQVGEVVSLTSGDGGDPVEQTARQVRRERR